MIKPPANHDEFELLLNYFWDRLGDDLQPTARTTTPLTLTKPAAYQARKALRHVLTPADLVVWAEQWLTGDAWQRARSRVRAKRYRDRNQLVRTSMTTDTKALLDARAKAMKLPLWAYLEALSLDADVMMALEHRARLSSSPPPTGSCGAQG